MKRERALLILLLLFASNFSFGILKTIPASQSIERLKFRTIDARLNPHISNSFFSMQDSSGYMWFSTYDALCRYDGTRIQPFFIKDSLANNLIFSSTLERDSLTLWVATRRGLFIFNKLTQQFTPCRGTETYRVYRILPAGEDNLWLSTNGDILLYNTRNGTVRKTNPESIIHYGARMPHYSMYGYLSPDGQFFTGTFGYCLYYSREGQNFNSFKVPSLNNSKLNHCGSIIQHKNDANLLYLGTEQGLFLYNLKNGDSKLLLEADRIDALKYDPDGRLFVGTSRGLFVSDKDCNLFEQYVHSSNDPSSICDNFINNISFDNQNNVWLSTKRGVSVAELSSGTIRVDLSEITGNTQGNYLTKISRTRQGKLLMAGDNGLVIYDEKNKESILLSASAADKHRLLNNNVHDFYFDNESQVIWLGTNLGLHSYDLKKDQVRSYTITTEDLAFSSTWIYAIQKSKQGELYLTTYENGVFVVDCATLLSSKPDQAIKAKRHLSDKGDGMRIKIVNELPGVYLGDSTSLWVYYSHNGVERFPKNPKNKSASTNMSNGKLGSNQVLGILPVRNGELLATSVSGFTLINPENNTARELRINSIVPPVVAISPGIDSDELFVLTSTGIFRVSVAKASITEVYDCLSNTVGQMSDIYFDKETKKLYWATRSTYGYIDTESAMNVHSAHRLAIDGLRIFDRNVATFEQFEGHEILCKALEFGPSLTLPSNQNTITFEYSLIDYSPLTTRHYKYRLAGFSDSWVVEEGGSAAACFFNLPYGKYRFEVVALNALGESSSNPASINLRILAPWYLSTVAYIIYVLLVLAGIGAIVINNHQRHQRQLRRIRREKSLHFSNMRIAYMSSVFNKLSSPLARVISMQEDSSEKRAEAQKLQRVLLQLKDVTETSPIDSSKLSTINMIDFCTEIIDNFRPLALEQRVNVSFESNNPGVVISTDVIALRLAFTNILSHVLSLSEVDSNIMLSLKADLEKINVVISSTSNRSAIYKLWHRVFYSYDKLRNSGLEMSNEFIEQCGGHLTWERHSPSLNFNVVLPRVAKPLADDLDALSTQSNPFNKIEEPALSHDDKFLDDMNKIISEDITKVELSVSYLSNKSGLSTKAIYHHFKKATDLSPTDYIRLYRLRRAAFLLTQKGFSVSEVLYMVGFSSHSYFTKCFKATFGVTPKEFSRQNQVK
ncbi:MAG: helix-turn-helix domain-containing protein [Prolixibacteraceae bacterium]